MSIPGYVKWAIDHLTAYGLNSPAALDAVKRWEPVLEAMQADVAELAAATTAMLGSAEPITGYLDGHRTRLLATVRSARAAEITRQEEERAVCQHCGGSGRLIVPALMPPDPAKPVGPGNPPRAVHAGHWTGIRWQGGAVFYTVAVRCSCERGRCGSFFSLKREGAATLPDRSRPLMCLAEYEEHNPRWREQLKQRTREQLAEAYTPGEGDKLLERYDKALDNLKARVGGKGTNGQPR